MRTEDQVTAAQREWMKTWGPVEVLVDKAIKVTAEEMRTIQVGVRDGVPLAALDRVLATAGVLIADALAAVKKAVPPFPQETHL